MIVRALGIARTGLDAQQINLDVIANNLANTSTPGYKKGRAEFEDLLYQTIRLPGAQSSQATQVPTGLQLGSGVQPISTATIFTEGVLEHTGKDLDVAIDGVGFLQVLLPDGTLAYTRDGALHQDSTGQVVTSAGYPLQPSITIPTTPTGGAIGISAYGEVSYGSLGVVGTIQVATFVNNGGLLRIGGNLFKETASSGTATPAAPGSGGAGTLKQYYTESSNVNVAEEMVDMIQTQRAYELNSKVVSTADAMLAKLSQL